MHLTDLFPNTFAAVRQQPARDTQPKRVLIALRRNSPRITAQFASNYNIMLHLFTVHCSLFTKNNEINVGVFSFCKIWKFREKGLSLQHETNKIMGHEC